MTEQQTNWLDSELDALINSNETAVTYLEPLKLLENKITEITFDFSKAPEKKPNKLNPNTKQALIPCKVGNKDYTFWLNVQNPLYGELLKQAKAGKNTLKILRTGKQKETRYTIVD